MSKPVRLAVEPYLSQETKRVKVYNLTLANENAYYANGVLVQNCADSCTLLWEVARQRHGLSSTEKAAAKPPPPVLQKTIFDQVYDLSGYKEPKKVERTPLHEAAFYESMGGGWADY